MIVYVSAVIGMCAFLITWAIGLNADVGGLIAVGCVGIGILVQMVSRTPSSDQAS
jgi:hypothetical protein